MTEWERHFVETQRVARLATVGPDGQPAVVPVVYAFDGERFVTPLDGKPKTVDARKLRRVRNIEADDRVALVIDRYDEDWRRLAWVHVRGRAELLEEGEVYERGIALLAAKYRQYGSLSLDGRPLIAVAPTRVSSWRAAP